MKTTMILILGVAVMATMPVLSLEFRDDAHANSYFAAINQAWQNIRGELKLGTTDDAALRKAILGIYDMGIMPYATIEDAISHMKEMVEQDKIPHERVSKMIEILIRERLSAIEKGEGDKIYWNVDLFLPFLDAFPDHDIVPLLKECLQSKSEEIRNEAQKRYNAIIEKAKEQSSKGVNGKPKLVTPPSSTTAPSPQPEPTPSIVASEPTPQPVQETPSEQPEKAPTNKTVLWVSVITFLAIIGGVTVMWRKNQ